MDDRRNNRTGAGAGAEAAVAKALSLLPLLLDFRPRPTGAVAAVAATVATHHQSGKSARDKTKELRGAAAVAAADSDGSALASGAGGEEIEAVLSALLAVIRRGSALNREAALAALGSKVLPRLGGAAAGGREWLGELITDEELLVAAIKDRSSLGAACHQRALGLTYQLLASSPELMSLALEPGCPLLPAVLDALDDGGGVGGVGGSGDTPGLRGAGATGVDGPGNSQRRITGGTPKDGTGSGSGGGVSGVAPGTPRSAPRTPRLSGNPGDRRVGRPLGGADGEAAGRSGLAVLRIVGLVSSSRVRVLPL